MNLNSSHIHSYMKAHLFKPYIRPILTYDIENMELNGNELLEFKKIFKISNSLWNMDVIFSQNIN